MSKEAVKAQGIVVVRVSVRGGGFLVIIRVTSVAIRKCIRFCMEVINKGNLKLYCLEDNTCMGVLIICRCVSRVYDEGVSNSSMLEGVNYINSSILEGVNYMGVSNSRVGILEGVSYTSTIDKRVIVGVSNNVNGYRCVSNKYL
ncbi:hypothetical protein CWI38_0214p0050 [Hamiltosporidium tvaerminnensis]|uniref:Uncharacterized protein n=1 Tax=Hamiltosporidium tvaerminnensis TaxID=1176355 RepID=A0A4Q9M227_9MICR|nr:hypothetical protein CWI38_0214p0050 [Hamiltosporidium tvaerminnensis]